MSDVGSVRPATTRWISGEMKMTTGSMASHAKSHAESHRVANGGENPAAAWTAMAVATPLVMHDRMTPYTNGA